jgi:hypothetical protein
VRGTHGALDVQTLDVLPVLGEEGDQEVDSQDDVGGGIFHFHADVGNGDTHANCLLGFQGKLDGLLQAQNFGGDVITGVVHGGEFAGLVETRTQQTGDLTDQSGGRQECVVLGSQLFDKLFVLVHFFEILNGTGSNTSFRGVTAILFSTQQTNVEFLTRGVGDIDGTGETFVFLGIVILEGDLELDGLDEVSLLLRGVFEDAFNGVLNRFVR